MLSVEPWLVELGLHGIPVVAFNLVSVLSVEPWLVELVYQQPLPEIRARFSALSRAVVGGTAHRRE